MNRLAVVISMAVLMCLGSSVARAEAGRPKILFDEGHDQRFVIEETGELQLSELAETMRVSGATVVSTKDILSDDLLKDAAALVISGPFRKLDATEVEAVVRFIQRGGRVAAMMHIGPPLANLLFRFGLAYSKSVLHERQNVIDEDINFRVTDLSASPLFSGMDSFSAYGVWALNAGDTASWIARTSPTAWIDMDNDRKLSPADAVGAFAVAVTGTLGSGSFVIFGDDAIFQNKFLEGNNRKLAVNLSKWLVAR
jgi:hypothetical protein